MKDYKQINIKGKAAYKAYEKKVKDKINAIIASNPTCQIKIVGGNVAVYTQNTYVAIGEDLAYYDGNAVNKEPVAVYYNPFADTTTILKF